MNKKEYNIYSYNITIRESHLDTFGHVNNAVYLQLYEEARWELITSNGYGLKKIRETGMGPTVLDLKLSFLKELRLREEITIYTQLLEYPSKAGTIKQWINKENGECSSEMIMKFGLFDTNARKLVMPTPDWIKGVTGNESL